MIIMIVMNLEEIIFLEDLFQQFKSEVIIGSRTVDNRSEFNERCSWNWSGNNPNLKIIFIRFVHLVSGKIINYYRWRFYK